MSEMIPLAFEGVEVRAEDRDGSAWFVGADVCRALGIRHVATAMKRLDPDEKGVAKNHTLGGLQDLTVISEAGVYKLLARSSKPEAKRFDRWVRHEVLPTLRRTGSYTMGAGAGAVDLRDPAQLAAVAAQLAGMVQEGQQRIARLQPVADAYERIADGTGAMSITEAAKALKVPPRQMGEWLRDRRWVYRVGEKGPWMAYQRFIASGLLEHRVIEIGSGEDPALPGKVVTQVRVTARGLARLALLLTPVAEPGPQVSLPLVPTSAPAGGSRVH